ncbi:hypothetical protein IAU60_004757 [Kwoniella sp. DSM 27419]
MEAKLQKLKVAELKELLAKHHLVQTGKKEELVKRLVDNKVGVDEEPIEELVDVDASEPLPELPGNTVGVPAVPAPSTDTQPAASTDGTTVTQPTIAEGPVAELTEEQKAMKARAERFGIPFNPNPQPKPKSKPVKAEAAPSAPAESAPVQKEKPQKAGAIDAKPLGLSEEVLARRAAKFGLPEKKAEPAPSGVTEKKQAAKPVKKEEPKKEEITPEMAEKLAVEEEKKRKRAEKFGIKPVAAETNGSAEPDAKKTKV